MTATTVKLDGMVIKTGACSNFPPFLLLVTFLTVCTLNVGLNGKTAFSEMYNE